MSTKRLCRIFLYVWITISKERDNKSSHPLMMKKEERMVHNHRYTEISRNPCRTFAVCIHSVSSRKPLNLIRVDCQNFWTNRIIRTKSDLQQCNYTQRAHIQAKHFVDNIPKHPKTLAVKFTVHFLTQ